MTGTDLVLLTEDGVVEGVDAVLAVGPAEGYGWWPYAAGKSPEGRARWARLRPPSARSYGALRRRTGGPGS